MPKTAIISSARAPMEAFQGAFASFPSPQLGSVAVRAALDKAGLADDKVDEVIIGCVLSADFASHSGYSS